MQLCHHLPLRTVIPVLPLAQPRQHHLDPTGGCACNKPPPRPPSLPQRLNRQVENQPGCPLHPSVLTSDVLNLALGNGIKVDFHQRPQEVGVRHHALGGFPVEFFVAFHDEDAFADRLHLLRGLSKGPGGGIDTYEDRAQDVARIWPEGRVQKKNGSTQNRLLEAILHGGKGDHIPAPTWAPGDELFQE